VEGSSPTITRSIRLTNALASSVSWTLADIQVGDPTTPDRDVSSDYVTVAGESLTNYLGGLAYSSSAVVADLVLDLDDVDGTATAFTLIYPSGASTGFTVDGTIDLASFQALLSGAFPTGATIAIPYGDNPGLYTVTAANVDEPWATVDGGSVRTTAGTYTREWRAIRVGDGPFTTVYPDPDTLEASQSTPPPLVDGGVWALTAGDSTSYFSCPVPGPLDLGVDVRFKVAALDAPTGAGYHFLEIATIQHPSFTDLDLLEVAFQIDRDAGIMGHYAEFHREGDPLAEAGEFAAGRIFYSDSDWRIWFGHAWEGAYTIDPVAGEITMWLRVLDNGDWITADKRHYRRLASKTVDPFDISTAIDVGKTLKVGIHDGRLATAYMEIRNGIDGDLWANLPLDGTTDDAGNTWTIHGTASVVDTTIAGLASAGGGGLALGETSTTAYRGDRGKTAYDHTSLTNNPHSVTAAQVGAPATTLTITAGTGLTGGGDLSANRTLAVDSAVLARIPTTVRVASDVNSTTDGSFTNTTGLAIPVTNGTTTYFHGLIDVTGIAAADLKLTATCPAGTIRMAAWGKNYASSATAADGTFSGEVTSSGEAVSNFAVIAGRSTLVPFSGYFTATADGTVQIQHAQRTANATATTVKAGSYLTYHT